MAEKTATPAFDFGALQVADETEIPQIRRPREGGPNPMESKIRAVKVGKAGSVTLPARHAPDAAKLLRRAGVSLKVSVLIRFTDRAGAKSLSEERDKDGKLTGKLRDATGAAVHENTQVKVIFAVRELKPRDRYQVFAPTGAPIGERVSLSRARTWIKEQDNSRGEYTYREMT